MGKTRWQKLLGWSEDHLEEIRQCGFSYIRQGRYDIAVPLFQALVVMEDATAYDFQTLGALYVEIDRPEEALRWLEKGLKLEPDHACTLLNYAKALFMLGNRERGLELARKLAKHKEFAIASMAKALILAYS